MGDDGVTEEGRGYHEDQARDMAPELFAEWDERCPTCHGDQWVIVGTDIDCDDGVNGPYDGETIRCPNCHGSGKAADCWYW